MKGTKVLLGLESDIETALTPETATHRLLHFLPLIFYSFFLPTNKDQDKLSQILISSLTRGG